MGLSEFTDCLVGHYSSYESNTKAAAKYANKMIEKTKNWKGETKVETDDVIPITSLDEAKKIAKEGKFKKYYQPYKPDIDNVFGAVKTNGNDLSETAAHEYCGKLAIREGYYFNRHPGEVITSDDKKYVICEGIKE